MIIPKYWAEARLQHREGRRQVTLRRFGWSDESDAAAQAHADLRVREAMDRVLAGEELPRRERRVAYNGAEGVPIREEIVDRHGDSVITRNGYGALCLNTPDVLFADIDAGEQDLSYRHGCLLIIVLTFVFTVALKLAGMERLAPAVGIGFASAWALSWFIDHAYTRFVARPRARDARERWDAEALARIRAFADGRRDWCLRVYRTPAGFRLLAMHRTFDPRDPEVAAMFDALGVDSTYALMCFNQHCFRARISPKPWRMGLERLHAPYAATWRAEHADLRERREWIRRYDAAASRFASCRFVETLGQGGEVPEAIAVREVHDLFCRADQRLPLA
ncbi:hypothetical protein [Lysobacter brunescens]|uniref:Transmembrane protein n=1 Tax=Lysobacter brunescens TaxID=262323 RepID=A0ABW2YCH5_9GAMM